LGAGELDARAGEVLLAERRRVGRVEKDAGLDPRTVQRIESGKPATLPTVRKLAAVLKVRPDQLQAQPPTP